VDLDEIIKLVDAGNEKSHRTYNEVRDLIPQDAHSSEDVRISTPSFPIASIPRHSTTSWAGNL